ncbi:MAG: glycosyl hydrolase [Acidobacteriaceae bacterium]
MRSRPYFLVLLCSISLLLAGHTFAQTNTNRVNNTKASLKAGFHMPPESARPRVWWHWMNGNISRKGIKLDLEWMHRIGLGGIDTIDASLATPQVVPHRIIYMTPEWKSDFLYATQLAEKFGMKESIDSSPGWSETGGPWVRPSQGMKKYVWSKIVIEGGRHFDGKLPHPPVHTGAFQDEDIHDVLGRTISGSGIPQYYRDTIVIAYKLPRTDIPLASLHPVLSSSGGHPDFAMLSDGNLVKTTSLPISPVGSESWIQYAFSQPQTIRAVTIVMPNTSDAAVQRMLQASNDGDHWRNIASLNTGTSPQTTVSFPAATAKYFRVIFQRPPPSGRPAWTRGISLKALFGKAGSAPRNYHIAELVLHPGARVNHFEEKAAFVPAAILYNFPTPDYGANSCVKVSDVINLTSRMQPDGTLDWTPPPGRWVILRFGYSLLGITNHPAPVESTGLEVDKLNGNDVHQYIENYLNSYQKAVGASNMGQRGITSLTNDSWEAGSQNWTNDIIQQFRKLRGYNPIPWMPVLTGVIVGSPAQSDRFLWDFRETIGDLTATQHYGVIQQVLNQWHIRHYCESDEFGRAIVADGMELKKDCQVPMGAMWTWTVNPRLHRGNDDYVADDRESASVAHIYGQNLVAAESLTAAAAPWAWSPQTLKPTIDEEFLNGINRIYIHESTHQPLIDKKPGLTLGHFGQWFNRNETWANEASPWITYLARNSYMMQQGRYAADILYYYGEDTNLTAIYQFRSPNLPNGYDFDYVNADALRHVLKVNSRGEITTPGGVVYRILGLNQNSRHMSLPVLRAIDQLVTEGATIAGPMPIDDPSLADNQSQFHALVHQLFGDGSGVHHVGKGTVYAGQTVAAALAAMHVAPDFRYTARSSDAEVKFIHRVLPHADIYFVDNRTDTSTSITASFRVSGRVPTIWHATTGNITPASYTIARGRTTIPLHLGPWDSVYVVFRGHASTTSWTAPQAASRQLATLHGPWKVTFPPNWGAPPSITFNQLTSWSNSSNTGVRYFSGTATYTNILQAPPTWFQHGAHLWIDLGTVKNLAKVSVNGKPLGIVWHQPFRVDATTALHPGTNTISIQVTNAWVNRLIGDQQPDALKQYTFTDYHPYTASSPLQASGLLGPVTIHSVIRQ